MHCVEGPPDLRSGHCASGEVVGAASVEAVNCVFACELTEENENLSLAKTHRSIKREKKEGERKSKAPPVGIMCHRAYSTEAWPICLSSWLIILSTKLSAGCISTLVRCASKLPVGVKRECFYRPSLSIPLSEGHGLCRDLLRNGALSWERERTKEVRAHKAAK